MRRKARGAFVVAIAVVAAACGGNSGTRGTPNAPPSGDVEALRATAIPLTGTDTDFDSLVRFAGDARVVLLGEQTHGTHEFYVARARITQRLIEEHGFSAVAIEGDWPDAYRVNRYVRGIGTDASPEQALSSFTRFPRWMWRNEEVRDLVRWMRAHNDALDPAQRAGFYGLDVYSLYEAIDEVQRHLGATDTAGARRARASYRCFEPYRPEAQGYGAATRTGISCEAQAAAVLRELEERAATRPVDPEAAEALFSALRNAHSVANAESYFRTAYLGLMSTWNLRDQRMAEGLEALERHLQATTGRPAKIVVWAHNTHAGDARVTEPGERGELNIGQLTRQRHGSDAVLVGFLTFQGEVLAASEWDEPGREQTLRPALPESFAALLHATGIPDFVLLMRAGADATRVLSAERLERAVGVVYVPRTERQSHYFVARLGRQFDAAVYFDVTEAVRPLP